MRLTQGEAFNDLLRSATFEAFHLEVKDTYECPEDVELLTAFLEGEPDDYAWMSEWAEFVAELTAAGVAVRRARVVTVPHADWTRWGLAVSEVNVAAGEDLRYLPRHEIAAAAIGADDWWMIDDHTVAYTIFDDEGRWKGAAVSEDSYLVARCRSIRNAVWDRSIPRAEYLVDNQR